MRAIYGLSTISRKLHGFGGFRKMNLWQQDKEQAACVAAVREGKSALIPWKELLEVRRVTFEIARAASPLPT